MGRVPIPKRPKLLYAARTREIGSRCAVFKKHVVDKQINKQEMLPLKFIALAIIAYHKCSDYDPGNYYPGGNNYPNSNYMCGYVNRGNYFRGRNSEHLCQRQDRQ